MVEGRGGLSYEDSRNSDLFYPEGSIRTDREKLLQYLTSSKDTNRE